MANIDIEKFISSLIERSSGITQQIFHSDLLNALKEQGLEYKNGEIVKTQRRVAAEAKEAIFNDECEMIRKRLLTDFSILGKEEWGGLKVKDICAWLEKQGKQKPIKEHDACEFCEDRYGCVSPCSMKLIEEEKSTNKVEQKPILNFKASNFYVSKVDGKIHDITYNSTDKVEPKFHEGDLVVDNCSYVWKIEGILNQFYLLEGVEGGESRPTIEWVDKTFHLWTIQDAKDGDVLIDKSHVGECVFIFKEARPSDIKTDVNNPLAIIGYCGINHIGFTSQLSGLGFGDTVNCTYYPATKEQCDTLEMAMTNYGYRWNKEELKLEKI